jgi:hypothetical protein
LHRLACREHHGIVHVGIAVRSSRVKRRGEATRPVTSKLSAELGAAGWPTATPAEATSGRAAAAVINRKQMLR